MGHEGQAGLRRLLRRTKTGLLRVDRAAAAREARLDGKWLLRTNDHTLTPEDLAAAYKQLIAVERGWRDMKGALGCGRCSTTAKADPRPRPAVLARPAADPGSRERRRRHLAQHAP